MPPAVFTRRPGIQQGHTSIPGQLCCIGKMPLLQTLGNVVNHKARHIHRVLGRGIGRRISKIQVLQFRCLHSGMNGGSQHIDPLIHTVVAHDLCAQQAVGFLFKNHLHSHQLAAGIVACVTHGGQDHRVHIQAGFSGIGLIDAGSGCGHVKDPDDAASLAS